MGKRRPWLPSAAEPADRLDTVDEGEGGEATPAREGSTSGNPPLGATFRSPPPADGARVAHDATPPSPASGSRDGVGSHSNPSGREASRQDAPELVATFTQLFPEDEQSSDPCDEDEAAERDVLSAATMLDPEGAAFAPEPQDASLDEVTLAAGSKAATLKNAQQEAFDEHMMALHWEELMAKHFEREATYQQAAERPCWGPKRPPPKDEEAWNGRHQLMYVNDGLNPNYRSYFDRWIDRKAEKDGPLGPLKPEWRLNPDAQTREERAIAQQNMKAFSATTTSTCRSPDPPGKKPFSDQHVYMQSLEPVNWRMAPGLEKKPGQPQKRSKSESRSAAGSTTIDGKVASSQQESTMLNHTASAPALSSACGSTWDSRHHITWCNERSIISEVKNPLHLRSYFDRPRDPGASRSESFRAKTDTRDNLTRVMPSWRLTPPFVGKKELEDSGQLKLGSTTTSFASSPGAGETRASSRADLPLEPDVRMPPRGKANVKREARWDTRHSIVFNNEEQSKLDRSYFDRWREPEVLLKPHEKLRRAKITWSLGRGGDPKEAAAQVWDASEKRHGSCGKWDPRHERCFDNRMHQNARSYFDRHREHPVTAVSPQDIRPVPEPGPDDPNWELHTESSAQMRRRKLQEHDRLPVMWKITELSGKAPTLDSLLRRVESDPDTLTAKKQKKRREAWFASHGIHF